MEKILIDVIIQGPQNYLDREVYREFLKSLCAYKNIKTVYISSTYNIDLEGGFDSVQCRRYEDPGEDVGNFRKPLNLKRYVAGLSNVLTELESRTVLVIRSDVVFDISLLLKQIKLEASVMNLLDVTTKSQFIQERWVGHFSDWLYLSDVSIFRKALRDYDYQDITRNKVLENGALYPVSPEKYLHTKFLETGRVKKINVIQSKSINLRSLKPEYNKIPFGINEKYMITKFESKYLMFLSDVKFFRIVLSPIMKLVHHALFLIKKT